MWVFAEAKNGDEQFWNIEISCRQWEGSACTHDGPCFLLFEGVGGEGIYIFPCVPNVFSPCSQRVLKFANAFPLMFPIAPGLSHMVFPKFNFYGYKLKR
jgi:hypothetical protein